MKLALFILSLHLCALLPLTSVAETENQASVSLPSGNEINFTRYPAAGKKLLLWFYSEAGPQAADKIIAQQLNELGFEVWLIDLFDSYFLPVSLSSMDKIPADDIKQLFTLAASKTAKQVIPVSSGRSAIVLLSAARQLQLDKPDIDILPGLILISPKFYAGTPEPGTEARLMPIVKNSNKLIFIMQPTKSPWYWKLDETVPALEKNGSDVFIQRISRVRDRFYFRPDADAYEQAMTKQLPLFIRRAVSALSNFPVKNRVAVKTNKTLQTITSIEKQDRKLRPHKGNPVPEKLSLTSLDHTIIDLKDQTGKVVLVNFWATWCPPCVHEMPSMERLYDRFSESDFTILGVNMAEDETTIYQFLEEKVAVNFPILLDSDGNTLKRWQVFAFPTSYVVDKTGRIRYSLFGSIEWDQPESIKIIQQLIDEE